MKLLTKEILNQFKKQGSCSEKQANEVKVVAKFFNPVGSATWYATEYHADEKMFYGFVSLFNDPACDEFGPFSLTELESLRLPLGLGIERDINFKSGSYTLQDLYNGKRP